MQITHYHLILHHLQIYPPDLLITPRIPEVDTLDLHKARQAIAAGMDAWDAAVGDAA